MLLGCVIFHLHSWHFLKPYMHMNKDFEYMLLEVLGWFVCLFVLYGCYTECRKHVALFISIDKISVNWMGCHLAPYMLLTISPPLPLALKQSINVILKMACLVLIIYFLNDVDVMLMLMWCCDFMWWNPSILCQVQRSLFYAHHLLILINNSIRA